MNKYIYSANGKPMYEDLKFWCSGCGELHHHGEYDITEEELPKELKRAYKTLWSDNYGSYCYIVETPKGYGITLINEYHQCFADDCNITMEELFASLIKDGDKIALREEFQNADIYLGEYSGFDECHELITVFSWDISEEEFTKAAELLNELAFQSANETAGTLVKKEKFIINVEETYASSFTVEATNYEEAIEMIRDQYEKGDIRVEVDSPCGDPRYMAMDQNDNMLQDWI